jgi:hypothetical protein
MSPPPPRRVVLSEKSGKIYLEANDKKLQVVLSRGGMYREVKTHEGRKTQKPRQSVVVMYLRGKTLSYSITFSSGPLPLVPSRKSWGGHVPGTVLCGKYETFEASLL